MKNFSKSILLRLTIVIFTLLILTLPTVFAQYGTSSDPAIIDPLSIPKWTNQLDSRIPAYTLTNVTDSSGNVIRQECTVSVSQFNEQMLPTVDASGNPTEYGSTKVWGYGGETYDPVTGQNLGFVASAPGPTFEATRGIPIQLKWVNNLVDGNGKPLSYMYPVDPTIHWANPNNIDMTAAMQQTMDGQAPPYPPGYNGAPYTFNATVTNPDGWNAQSPVPIVTHLHGGQVLSDYDGGPEQWFTPNGIRGKDYRTYIPTDANADVYYYPNAQEPTALWYHDHALGLTRLSVQSGLAGYYLIRDPNDTIAPLLPSGQYEMPLIIQDRTFLTDGSIYYPSDGLYPNYNPIQYPTNYTKTSPYSMSGFVGNTIIVNGKVWPNLNVAQGQYRFRLLDASNSRFYNISLSNNMPFTLIGSDGGYIKSAVNVTSTLFSPGERVDILIDFSKLAAGEKVILKNNALWNISSPKYPNQPQTIGQIMQFTVTSEKGFEAKTLPTLLDSTLAGAFPNLSNPSKTRVLTLGEDVTTLGPAMPMDLYLDGQKWSSAVSETPQLGSTEDWVLVNTFDTHNIHLHLVQFQLVSRQRYNTSAYFKDWTALNGEAPFNHTTKNVPSLTPYLIGQPITPSAAEQEWKDTIIVYSNQITTIRVRFAPQDNSSYPFDATTGPGYVWHCHILEHEDNEMMRPYILTAQSSNKPVQTVFVAVVVLAVFGITALLVGVRLYTQRSRKNASEHKPS
jgi:spore coat protein A, manganese oxidase